MDVAELESLVKNQTRVYDPENFSELITSLGYQPVHQDRNWQVFTKGNEFVAVRNYKPTILSRKSLYPVSGEFESLDEVIDNLKNIKRSTIHPFEYCMDAALWGAGAVAFTGVTTTIYLSLSTKLFSENPELVPAAVLAEGALTLVGLLYGATVGSAICRWQTSKLSESAIDYNYGHEAAKDLLSKA